MTMADLPAEWRARAGDLKRFAPPAAEAFLAAAADLEDALRQAADEVLTYAQAVEESGYSERRLRELIVDGKIPNAGRKGRPRIRRADLPRKANGSTNTAYDPAADAARLMRSTR